MLKLKTKRDYDIYIMALKDAKDSIESNLEIGIRRAKDLKEFVDIPYSKEK